MTNTNLEMMAVDRERSGTNTAVAAKDSTVASMEAHPAWPMIGRLPVLLAVRVPLRGFLVRDILALRCGQIAASACAVTDDVPLQTGTLDVCWGEFEVVEQRIAIRLTRLA
jgi:hypothetical protein